MTQRQERLAVAVVFAALAVLAAVVAPRLFVLFDEAYNLNVSLNLAEKGMYAARLGDWFLPFTPEVSTGPALLVPLAAVLRLAGPSLVAVRAAMLAAFVLSLLLAYLSGRELLPGTPLALALVAIFAFTPLALEFGLSVLGDIPAIALGLAGFALLQRAKRSAQRQALVLVLSGCAWGLALLAKDIMLLLLPAVVAAWAVRRLIAAPAGKRDDWRMLAPVAIAGACAAGWRAFTYAAVHASLPAADAALWHSITTETTRRMWSAVSFDPFSHLASAFDAGVQYFLPLLLGLVVALGGYAIVRRLPPAAGSEETSLAHAALAAACALWLVWFFLLSGPQANQRHLLPGVVLGEVLTIRLAARLFSMGRSHRPARLAAALLAVCLLWSILHGAGFLRLYLASSERRLAAQQQAAAWLRANTPVQAVVSGWGWYAPWHVGFLAGRTVARIDPASPSLQGATEWFVLCPEIEWDGATSDRLRDFLARHGPPVLEQRLYPVYRVTTLP